MPLCSNPFSCYTHFMNDQRIWNLMFSIFLGIGIVLLVVGIAVYLISGSLFVAAIFAFQAVIWIAIGGIGTCVRHRKRIRNEELLRNGHRIQAKITDTYLDRSCAVNSRHPYRICCQYTDEGSKTVYVFRSEPIWINPNELMQGNEIDVCVDCNDFKHYVVDTASLMNGYTIQNF